jgi:DNA-binding protein, YbaB/EbfC family
MAGYAQMMKQMSKIQRDLERKQAELDEKEYTTEAGGGMVKVIATGKKEIIGLELDPSIIDPEDKEMLQDLIRVAINEAIKTVETETEAELGKITAGVNMPGLF